MIKLTVPLHKSLKKGTQKDNQGRGVNRRRIQQITLKAFRVRCSERLSTVLKALIAGLYQHNGSKI
jgi:hypothetical protein